MELSIGPQEQNRPVAMREPNVFFVYDQSILDKG